MAIAARDRVLAAAMRLFAEHGFAATTITQIEQAAGLSQGAGGIYRHFPSKVAIHRLEERNGHIGSRFEMPYGTGVQLLTPGPQRLAIYQATHADRGRSLAGRRDF